MSKPVIKRKDVVNRTGGIETDDGRTIYGFDAEVYMKMKNKEDPEWERKVGEWIEDVLGHSIEDTSNLWKTLKSGEILCELINVIHPGHIKKYSRGNNLHVLMERENINLYLDACWKLGVPRDGLFVTSDLHARRNMAGVLSNIAALSQIAQNFGHVKVLPIGGKKMNIPSLEELKSAGVSKWGVSTAYLGPITEADLVDDDPLEKQLMDTKNELKNALLEIERLTFSNEGLKRDITALRNKLRSIGDDGTTSVTPSVSASEVNILRMELEILTPKFHKSEERCRRLEEELKKKSETSTQGGLMYQLTRAENLVKTSEQRYKQREAELLAQINDLKKNQGDQITGNSKNTDENVPKRIFSSSLLVTRRQVENQDMHRLKRSLSTGHSQGIDLYHNYQEITESQLLKLQEILVRLMDSSHVVEWEEVKDLKDIFKYDSGRRYFVHMLRIGYIQRESKLVPYELTNRSFEVLLFIITFILLELDLLNGADYISGKNILEIAQKLYHKVTDFGEDGQARHRENVWDMIKSHFIWQSLFFWEEYFWDSIARRFQKKFGNSDPTSVDYSRREKEFLKNKLRNFAKNMSRWKIIHPEAIDNFVQNMSASIGLDVEQFKSIMEYLRKESLTSKIFGKLTGPNKTRRNTDDPISPREISSPSSTSPRDNSSLFSVKKTGSPQLESPVLSPGERGHFSRTNTEPQKSFSPKTESPQWKKELFPKNTQTPLSPRDKMGQGSTTIEKHTGGERGIPTAVSPQRLNTQTPLSPSDRMGQGTSMIEKKKGTEDLCNKDS